MARFDFIRQQFAAKRDHLRQMANDTDRAVNEGTDSVNAWKAPYKQLDSVVLPQVEEWLDAVKSTETEPSTLSDLQDEVTQWEAAPNDDRIKQVDAENGRLWRQLQAMRAKRGLRDVGRFIRGGDDKDNET
jgi:hypothetical protein